MKRLAAVAAIVLSGCAAPPGQLADENLKTMEREVNAPLSKVYSGLQSAARQCGGLVGGQQAEWYPAADMKSAKVDMYIPAMGGGRSDWVFGLIDLKAVNSETTAVTFSVQNQYDNPLLKKSGWWRPEVNSLLSSIESGDQAYCG